MDKFGARYELLTTVVELRRETRDEEQIKAMSKHRLHCLSVPLAEEWARVDAVRRQTDNEEQ
jgi:hypothetical protein